MSGTMILPFSELTSLNAVNVGVTAGDSLADAICRNDDDNDSGRH